MSRVLEESARWEKAVEGQNQEEGFQAEGTFHPQLQRGDGVLCK